jgi:hypothetical protein
VGEATAADNGGAIQYKFNEGGHQGSRGGKRGQEFFIENVFEELDAPGASVRVVWEEPSCIIRE